MIVLEQPKIDKVFSLGALIALAKKSHSNIYGVIGNPIKHSLSPVFQNVAFRKLNLDAIYVKIQLVNFLEEFKKILEINVKLSTFKGFNITVPYKEEILKLSNISLSKEVQIINSANTVKLNNNNIKLYNTDWIGFLEALRSSGINTLNNKNVLVLGAGGAAKAIIYALLIENANVWVWNRSKEKLKLLKDKFQQIKVIENLDDINTFDIIVNTTSAYLEKDNNKWLFDYNKISKNQIIFDIEYWETPLLKEARKKGAKTINGLKMLLYQGVESFKIWTGKEPPVDEMWKALREAFERSSQSR